MFSAKIQIVKSEDFASVTVKDIANVFPQPQTLITFETFVIPDCEPMLHDAIPFENDNDPINVLISNLFFKLLFSEN